jgi:CheY-like chemotaxis protein
MSVPQWLTRILKHYQIPFETHQHVPVQSASHLAHAEHISGRWVAKPVFLLAGRRLITVVIPAHARVDLDRVREVIGPSDLRLASEAEITARFKGCPAGAVPPLRLRGDQIMLMDRALAHFHHITFAAGTREDAISLRFRDWYRMVYPGIGRFAQNPMGDGHGGPPTVLVIEDEHDTNCLLCRLLESGGFSCRGVEEGGRAVVVAREMKPAAIVLDLMLPDMSGFEVVEELRRTGPLKAPPLVVVSALDNDDARRRGQELGADAYLTKPFTADVLLKELQGVMADARG